MSLYAIGDVHGCWHTLERLLKRLSRHDASQQLWFVGDLVNRGPHPLATLRFVRDLGDGAVTVLGNHDLRLLRMALAGERMDARGWLSEVFEARDSVELIDWLRHRPLIHRAAGWTLVHAGLLPGWSIAEAETRARRIESTLRSDGALALLELHRASPEIWARHSNRQVELASDLAALTRLRYCDSAGRSDSSFDGAPGQAPPELVPWFRHPARRSRDESIVFGHWSSLGLYRGEGVLAIDTACTRGGQLTAVDLVDGVVFSEPRDSRDASGA